MAECAGTGAAATGARRALRQAAESAKPCSTPAASRSCSAFPAASAIATNEGAKSFRITTATIAPELLVRAAPALDDTAYLEAAFKQTDEAPLLPGRVALYRDGIFVGRGQMALTPKDETVRLGFGADDKVKIARTDRCARSKVPTGIISTAKTDEREFKITVRNGHDAPVRVTIEDQLPVSEIDDVKVEMLPVDDAAERARRAQPSRRAGVDLRRRRRRGARDQARLAGALAGRQGDHLRAARRCSRAGASRRAQFPRGICRPRSRRSAGPRPPRPLSSEARRQSMGRPRASG